MHVASTLLFCKSLFLVAAKLEKKEMDGNQCRKNKINREKKGHLTEPLHGVFYVKILPNGGLD